MQIDHPFHVDDRRHTAAETGEEDHVRDLIEQVLFTNPGERVNRPDFGAGLDQLLFGPSSPEVATTVQSLVQGALQQWLADSLRVETVDIVADGPTLRISVQYTLLRNGQTRGTSFERSTAL
ncbi:MAG TPA: GPW/gp25 family protein [Thermoanaerobaculia bacterium]|nr:GPW/gp25 family protein [Thermoanaerobaculia bacterium]